MSVRCLPGYQHAAVHPRPSAWAPLQEALARAPRRE
jgi:hypothetical protein